MYKVLQANIEKCRYEKLRHHLFHLVSVHKPVQNYQLAIVAFKRILDNLKTLGITKVAIYGGGEHTRILYKNGAFDREDIVCIADSGKDKQGRKIAGFKIVSREMLAGIKPKAIIISSFAYEEEIKNSLMRDIRFSGAKICTIYQLPFFESHFDKVSYELITTFQNKSKKNKILYVAITPFYSITRQSEYFSAQGDYDIYYLGLSQVDSYNLGMKVNSVYHAHGSAAIFAWLISQLTTGIVHCYFSMNTNCIAALIKLVAKVPVVYEYNDISSFFYSRKMFEELYGKREYEIEKQAEEFIYSNMDGLLIQNSRAKKMLKKMYGEPIRYTYFHPKPNKSAFVSNRVEEKLYEDLRLVYAGVVAPTSFSEEIYGDIKIYKVISPIIASGIKFDIYYNCNMEFSDCYEDYERLSEYSGLFNFYKGLPREKILPILASYNYGCMLYDFSGVKVGKEHLSTIMPTKFVTYLEAGLPILVSRKLKYVSELVEENGIGCVIDDLTTVSDRLSKVDHLVMRQNVLKFRESVNLESALKDLEVFYDSLV